MENFRNKQSLSFKLGTVLSSVMKSHVFPLHPAQDPQPSTSSASDIQPWTSSWLYEADDHGFRHPLGSWNISPEDKGGTTVCCDIHFIFPGTLQNLFLKAGTMFHSFLSLPWHLVVIQEMFVKLNC